jgi:hypothetical protein
MFSMVLNISNAYCGDVSIAYVVFEAEGNRLCLSGHVTITCINPNKAPGAMSVIVELQNQGGIKYRVGDDNRIHLQVSQGIDIAKLVECLINALKVMGVTTAIFNNTCAKQ